VNTAWNARISTTDLGIPPGTRTAARYPLPSATIVPVKFPFKSVVTLVNGTVDTPTPEVFPGIVPNGGLKLIAGCACSQHDTSVFFLLNVPPPSERNHRESTGVVETAATGVIQLIAAVFDTAVPAVAVTVSFPFAVPA